MGIRDIVSKVLPLAKSVVEAVKKGSAGAIGFTGNLVTEHKLIRRILVIWAASVVTWVTYRIYVGPLAEITGNVVAAYTVTVGLLTLVMAQYQTQASKEKIAKSAQPAAPPISAKAPE